MAESDPDPGETLPNTADRARVITWSDEVLNLGDFENESGLPQVVRFEDRMAQAGVPGGSLPPGVKMYTDQPVLFYTRCSKRHVHARTIYHDATGPYYEVGQTLVIPEDFDGWFEIVPPDFGRGPFCRTIGQVAEIMPRKFFTRSNIRAIRVAEKSEEGDTEDTEKEEASGDGSDSKKFKDRRIPAGTVLKTLGTFAAKWQTTAQTGLLKKKKQEWMTIDVNFLKCEDTDGKEILIPLTTRGRFYAIYESGFKDSRAVYRMKDIISDFQIPLKVRMVYGKAPVVPCIFTGMLILKEEVKEDTIVASTILYQRNVLFELPVNAKCDVKTATEDDDYCDMRTYIDANNLCRKFAHAYSTLIKLSPELDTGQQPIQHIPTERRKTRDESLKTLDLITNISLTDDEPRDYFMDSSDTGSFGSSDDQSLGMGEMMELREIVLPRASQNMSSA